jgi:hypothetical protein
MDRRRGSDPGRSQIPEAAHDEPPILTPAEDADRAARRLDRQERTDEARWPAPEDPLRQGGELSPPPSKRT